MGIFCHLQSQRVSDITSQTDVIASFFEDVINQACRCCFTIRSRNTHHLRMCITTSKFYLTDNMNTLLLDFDNHWSSIRDAWTLNNLISIKNLFFAMLPLFPYYLMIIQQLLILVVNLRHVTNEHVESFFLGQHGSTCAALASSQYNDSLHLCHSLFILSSML